MAKQFQQFMYLHRYAALSNRDDCT